MRPGMGKSVFALVCLLAMVLVCGCSGKCPFSAKAKPKDDAASKAVASAPVADVKKLFDDACSVCHPTTKPANYKGNDAWKAIVDRMITQHDVKIAPENASSIVAYLDKTYPKKS